MSNYIISSLHLQLCLIKHENKHIKATTNKTKKNADNATKTIAGIEVIVNPVVKDKVAEISVPIAPVNTNLPALQIHLFKLLYPLTLLPIPIAPSNSNKETPAVAKAIIIKFIVEGINPSENTTPAATPAITPRTIPTISQIVSPILLHPQLSI
jgi:hypothetical protein